MIHLVPSHVLVGAICLGEISESTGNHVEDHFQLNQIDVLADPKEVFVVTEAPKE
jgi:hypothetical protein